jgi:hypothetical protein
MVDDQYKTFLVHYRYDGAEWGIQIPAKSFEDAEGRLARLVYGTVKGEVVMTLPASTGPLVGILCGLRNALRSLVAPQR